MDFKTLLVERRAIRDFQDKPVPLAVVREIIQDSCLAPTARNGQPCRFVIVQDLGSIRRLSQESKNNLLSDLQKNPDSPMKNYEDVLKDDRFNVFYNAPCLVCIIGPADLPSLDVDCGLTAAYFMFAATARGLGTCWIGLGAHIRDRAILDEIGVPEGYRIVAPLILGYPKAIPEPLERHAPDIAKIV